LGLDPATGGKLWECEGVKDYICPSVVAHQGVVYVTAGRKPRTLAIRAGGKGDVTQTHILWDLDKSPKVGTPLYYDGYLYWVGHQGGVTCVKADTGKVVFEQKLDIRGRGDKVYASLVAAGTKFYAVTRQDGVFVLATGPEFAELAHNQLGDASVFNATPAIVDGRLLLRSDRYLYCLGR
jgi:outer membrane protein assembly factor BamB